MRHYKKILCEDNIRKQKTMNHSYICIFLRKNMCNNVVLDVQKIFSFMLGFLDKHAGSHYKEEKKNIIKPLFIPT